MKKVSDIVAEIAAASREQSAGIEQVNSAVVQMDEMTQQNAALVEQATAASQSMAEQARELTNMMSRYRTSESQSTVSPAAALRPIETASTRRIQRRGTNRPFTGKPRASAKSGAAGAATAAASARAPAESKLAASAGASEWTEF
ncbi:MAG: hypothetical protein JO042_12345 [Sinobacteraceae bacterium]|nr:hypothetical protein [Nevskiaceae bacterium]